MYSFSYLEPVCCFMSSSYCYFLTGIQISQEIRMYLSKKKKKNNLSFREALIYLSVNDIFGLPRWASSEEAESSRRRHVRCGFHPSVGKIPWRRARQPTSVFWPGKFYGKRSLLAIVQAATNC